MSCYVDNVRLPFGRMIMCHLWADTLEELFKMVDSIGVQRKWLQAPPKASWVHFDISLGKKDLALTYGAILTDRYGPTYHVAKLQGDQRKLDLIDEIRMKEKRLLKRASADTKAKAERLVAVGTLFENLPGADFLFGSEDDFDDEP